MKQFKDNHVVVYDGVRDVITRDFYTPEEAYEYYKTMIAALKSNLYPDARATVIRYAGNQIMAMEEV